MVPITVFLEYPFNINPTSNFLVHKNVRYHRGSRFLSPSQSDQQFVLGEPLVLAIEIATHSLMVTTCASLWKPSRTNMQHACVNGLTVLSYRSSIIRPYHQVLLLPPRRSLFAQSAISSQINLSHGDTYLASMICFLISCRNSRYSDLSHLSRKGVQNFICGKEYKKNGIATARCLGRLEWDDQPWMGYLAAILSTFGSAYACSWGN